MSKRRKQKDAKKIQSNLQPTQNKIGEGIGRIISSGRSRYIGASSELYDDITKPYIMLISSLLKQLQILSEQNKNSDKKQHPRKKPK